MFARLLDSCLTDSTPLLPPAGSDKSRILFAPVSFKGFRCVAAGTSRRWRGEDDDGVPDQPRKQRRPATVMLPSGHVIMCDGDRTVWSFFEEKYFSVGLAAVSKFP